MKRIVITTSLLLASCLPRGLAQPPPVKKALQSALTWQYRWIEPIPNGANSLQCSVALFTTRAFAYCEPGPLEVDIVMDSGELPRVTSILRKEGTFEKALFDFRAHRNSADEPLTSVQVISIPVRDLGFCNIDWVKTKHVATTVLNELQTTELRSSGLSLKYPLVCDGDPFYMLYLMRGDNIRSIWKFTIGPHGEDFAWSFDSDSKQRALPKLAIENVKKEMWYTPPDK